VYRLDADGIIRSTVLPGTEETLADAQENIRTCALLGGGQRRPIVVDMRGVKAQAREARLYYSGPETAQVISAIALITGSRVSALIANFFITVSKNTIPTKLFTDETEALLWLKGFLG
jgi:hypothetical protein